MESSKQDGEHVTNTALLWRNAKDFVVPPLRLSKTLGPWSIRPPCNSPLRLASL